MKLPKTSILLLLILMIISARNDVAKAGEIEARAKPCANGKSYPVQLTFDDGPRMPETEKILDYLKSKNIKGTFLISTHNFSNLLKSGKPSAKEQNLIRLLDRMKAEGHTIGSHSHEHMDHSNPEAQSPSSISENLDKNEKTLKLLGLKPPMPFRFPYGGGWFGQTTPEKQSQADSAMSRIKQAGFQPTHWDIDTWDWSKIKRKALPDSLLNQICSHRGGIALLHDIHPWTADNLPAIVESIEKSGHKFVSLKDFRKLNDSLPANQKYNSLADKAAGIFSCTRPIGDLDQVWKNCTDYNQNTSDNNNGGVQ